MSATESDPEPDFPDVRMSAPMALTVLVVMSVIYGGLFAAISPLERMVGLALVASLILGTGLLLLSYIDMRTGLLPDVLTLPLIGLGLLQAIWFEPPLWQSILGAAVGYGLVSGLILLWRRVRQYEGMGLGDAKLLAAGGAWVGIGLLPMVLLVASGLGILSAFTVSQKTRNEGERVALPFGPFLGLGIWVSWCAGEMVFH